MTKPKSNVQCRGRNGWFAFERVDILGEGDNVSVEILSSRTPNNCAPITITGTSRELLFILLDALQQLAKVM